ncbi:MAG TPA: O-antigen ligase family protein [Puia sp.]|nr:O-antigen ligase family protein [Puia sp.]
MRSPFLQNKIWFSLTLAVLATTIFSWFNLNSYCIILLLLGRLWDGGPVRAIRTAFSNKYFLAYFALFMVDAIGLLYTHNLNTGGHIVEKDATLLAIPFILCAGPFTDERGYRKLMVGYCMILSLAAIYCLIMAAVNYSQDKNIYEFFYHPLSHAIHENAIYFSVFLIFGILSLLSPRWGIDGAWLSRGAKKGIRAGMVLFFTGMVILLASKLLLVVLFLILSHFVFLRYSIRTNRKLILAMFITCLLLAAGVIFTANPIKSRYLDIVHGDISMIKKDKFSQGTYFNGVQLRLIEWQFALEILKENNAWIYGVSPGDSQDLLNKKYIGANMYTGNPRENKFGFLTYNFHNQYIEDLVRSGLIGLAALLTVCGLLIVLVRKCSTREAFFTVGILLTLFLVESFITLQHGAFLFSFFPLLLLYSPKKAHPGME